MAPRRRLFRLGFGRPGPGRQVDWEIEHYLVEQTERLMAEGWTAEEARREAERRFGGLARQRRRIVTVDWTEHAMRTGAAWWGGIRSGVAQAIRRIRRSPGFVAGIVLTLGLGIGVNGTMFGIVDRLLLRPPEGVAHPEQVRRILWRGMWLGRQGTIPALTYSDVVDLRTVPQFLSVGAFTSTRRLTLGSGEGATEVRAVLATADFFTTLGAHAQLGRVYTTKEDGIGAVSTVVLGNEFWRRRFAGDPDVLGRTLEIAGNAYTVIGVMPRGFTGVDLTPVDVWLPAVVARHAMDSSDRFLTSRGYYWLQAVVRVSDEASAVAGSAAATALIVNARTDQVRRGQYDANTRVFTAPLLAARGPRASATSKVALWLAGVALAVLLIACANVANLFLAQVARRRREVAVRLSLGVTRSRLVAELSIEAVLLAGLGGVVALAVARWGGSLIRTLLIPDVLWQGSGLDGPVLAVTAALSVGAGLLAGLGPALRSARGNLNRDLLEGGRGSSAGGSPVRRGLTVMQAALSVVLLVGAGLFVRSLHRAANADLGLDTNRLVLASLEFNDPALSTTRDAAEVNRLYAEAIQRVRSVPGVARAAATDVPFQSAMIAHLTSPGVDSLPVSPGTGPFYYSVTPGYFRTVGLRVLRGRAILDSDGASAPKVALVNENMARTLWPTKQALGQCLYFDHQTECTTVVGVVENASTGDLDDTGALAYYLPLSQTGYAAEGLYVRTDRDPEVVAAAVAPVLRSFSPAVRYAQVQSLGEILAPQLRSWTLGASLFTAFGGLALLVAVVGLYSLLAFEVAQRRRDIGIRSALGASGGRLLRETLSRGTALAALGTVIGLAICLLAAPYVQQLLFHTDARDPLVLVVVVGVLLAVSGLASVPPALRSARTDPMEALRVE